MKKKKKKKKKHKSVSVKQFMMHFATDIQILLEVHAKRDMFSALKWCRECGRVQLYLGTLTARSITGARGGQRGRFQSVLHRHMQSRCHGGWRRELWQLRQPHPRPLSGDRLIKRVGPTMERAALIGHRHRFSSCALMRAPDKTGTATIDGFRWNQLSKDCTNKVY